MAPSSVVLWAFAALTLTSCIAGTEVPTDDADSADTCLAISGWGRGSSRSPYEDEIAALRRAGEKRRDKKYCVCLATHLCFATPNLPGSQTSNEQAELWSVKGAQGTCDCSRSCADALREVHNVNGRLGRQYPAIARKVARGEASLNCYDAQSYPELGPGCYDSVPMP